jgi:CheY-like chemotaxis protein
MSKKNRVLICDDDEALCYLLKEQLLEEDFDVDTVYDGSYAIEFIKQKKLRCGIA